MPFARPTLAQLRDRVRGDLDSALDGVDSRLARSVAYALAYVVAMAAHLLYAFFAWAARQLLPGADSDPEYIARWGAIAGIPSPTPATYAALDVVLYGEEGSVFPEGGLVQRPDGVQYAAADTCTVPESGLVLISFTCTTVGTAGNVESGETLSLVSPVEGFDTETTPLVDTLVPGSDEETTARWFGRIRDRLADPPQGGCAADATRWAREVGDVTRAWAYPLELGRGTLTVRFVCDDLDPIIPTGGKVAEVAAWLESHADPASGRTVGRPVTADWYVLAPIADATDVEIDAPDATAEEMAAVEAELADLFATAAVPGGNVVLPDGTTGPAPPIYLGQIHGAISSVLIDYTLDAPAANVAPATGHVATLGTVTWS